VREDRVLLDDVPANFGKLFQVGPYNVGVSELLKTPAGGRLNLQVVRPAGAPPLAPDAPQSVLVRVFDSKGRILGGYRPPVGGRALIAQAFTSPNGIEGVKVEFTYPAVVQRVSIPFTLKDLPLPGEEPPDIQLRSLAAATAPAIIRTGSITGRIVSSDGTPAKGIKVAAFRALDSSRSPIALTNDKGEFEIKGAPDGQNITVRAATWDKPDDPKEGERFGWQQTAVTAQATTALKDEIRLGPTGAVKGKIVNADGTPAAGIFVRVNGPMSLEGAQTRTNEKGEFTLRGVPAATPGVQIAAFNYDVFKSEDAPPREARLRALRTTPNVPANGMMELPQMVLEPLPMGGGAGGFGIP
jgi:hypothetical protein